MVPGIACGENGDVVVPLTGFIAGLGHKARTMGVVAGVVFQDGVGIVVDIAPAGRAEDGVAFQDGRIVDVIDARTVQVQGIAALDVGVIVDVVEFRGCTGFDRLVGPSQMQELGIAHIDVVIMHEHDVSTLVNL